MIQNRSASLIPPSHTSRKASEKPFCTRSLTPPLVLAVLFEAPVHIDVVIFKSPKCSWARATYLNALIQMRQRQLRWCVSFAVSGFDALMLEYSSW